MSYLSLAPLPQRSSSTETAKIVSTAVTTSSARTAGCLCCPLSGNISTCPSVSVPAPVTSSCSSCRDNNNRLFGLYSPSLSQLQVHHGWPLCSLQAQWQLPCAPAGEGPGRCQDQEGEALHHIFGIHAPHPCSLQHVMTALHADREATTVFFLWPQCDPANFIAEIWQTKTIVSFR